MIPSYYPFIIPMRGAGILFDCFASVWFRYCPGKAARFIRSRFIALPDSCLQPCTGFVQVVLILVDLRPRRKNTAAPTTTAAMTPRRKGEVPFGSPTEKGKRETYSCLSPTVTRPTNLPGCGKLYSKLIEPLG